MEQHDKTKPSNPPSHPVSTTNPQQPQSSTEQTPPPVVKDSKDEEMIDDKLLDGMADDLEQKLNLTGGERTNEDDLGPEMDQYFENFMQKLQQEGGPEGAGFNFKDMNDMMKNMFNGAGMEGEDDGMDETEDGKKLDKMTDMLLEQFMDKEVLYEPLKSAKTELTTNIEKEGVDPKDKETMKAQLKLIEDIIETFDKDPTNKAKLISQFEEMNKVGSFFDIISKYSPQQSNKKDAFEELNNMMGGGANPFSKPGQEECRLI